jgi:hypothetical protein
MWSSPHNRCARLFLPCLLLTLSLRHTFEQIFSTSAGASLSITPFLMFCFRVSLTHLQPQANDETKVYDSRKGDHQLIKAKHFHRRQSRSGAPRGSGLRKSLSRSFSNDSVVYPELESCAPSMTGLIDMRAEARPSFAPRGSLRRECREGISLYGSDVLEILDRNEPLSFPPIQDVDIPAIIPFRPSSFDYSTPPPLADSLAQLPGTLPPSALLREHTSLLAQVALIVDPGPAAASTDRHSTANMPLGQQV